jgi:hypothetical protein
MKIARASFVKFPTNFYSHDTMYIKAALEQKNIVCSLPSLEVQFD